MGRPRSFVPVVRVSPRAAHGTHGHPHLCLSGLEPLSRLDSVAGGASLPGFEPAPCVRGSAARLVRSLVALPPKRALHPDRPAPSRLAASGPAVVRSG